MIQRKEVDFVAAALTITDERLHVANFTTSYWSEPIAVLAKRPPSRSKALVFMEPFKWSVWMLVFSTVLLSGPVLQKINSKSPYNSEGVKGEDKNNKLNITLNSSMYTLGALLQQSGLNLPKALSSRTFVAFWWLYVINVVTVYSGNFVGFLTVPLAAPKPFQTVEEMEESEFKPLVEDGSFLENFIRYKMPEIYPLMMGDKSTRFPATSRLNLLDEVMDERGDGDYAAISSLNHLLHLMDDLHLNHRTSDERHTCPYDIMIKELFLVSYSFGLQPHSPFLQQFNDKILEMLDKGIISKWIRHHVMRRTECTGKRIIQRVTRAVDLEQAWGIFMLYGMFLLLSLLAFAFEHWYKRALHPLDTDMIQQWIDGGVNINRRRRHKQRQTSSPHHYHHYQSFEEKLRVLHRQIPPLEGIPPRLSYHVMRH